jgi:hypothetical protein
MHQPQISYIPPKVFLKQLVDIPALKDKLLVTEVFSCPAYCLYLSNAGEHAFFFLDCDFFSCRGSFLVV